MLTSTPPERELSRQRIALGLVVLLAGLVLLGGLVIGVAAGIGAVWHATNPPPTSAASLPSSSSGASSVRLVVENVATPDGRQPAFVGPNGVGAKVLFNAVVGHLIEVTVVNRSPEPHIVDIQGLGVSTLEIPPGPSTTHFRVDPKRPGEVRWQCLFPCGGWVMAEDGYMYGDVKVTAS